MIALHGCMLEVLIDESQSPIDWLEFVSYMFASMFHRVATETESSVFSCLEGFLVRRIGWPLN